jgi:FAD/FMN-containing dehydrogenase/Fe-S oxidoreductase
MFLADVSALEPALHDLIALLGGENVKADPMTRLLYSTDASNYQVLPLGVVFPRSGDEVVAIHEVAARYKLPLIARGGGSGLAGQCLGAGLVLDFSRHLRRLISVNAEAQTVIAETGFLLGTLNQGLAPLGLMFGPDPSSAERATLGGCIANNSTGAHSIVYGMTADNLLRVEMVLADGTKVWSDADHPTLNRLRALAGDLARTHQAEIAARYPKTWRTVAGYALDRIDPAAVDLKWLLAGSEGTLATLTKAELKLVKRPAPAQKILALLHFDSLRAALEMTPELLALKPAAIELMDKFLLDKTRAHPAFRQRLTFVQGDPAALLALEFTGEDEAERCGYAEKLRAYLQAQRFQGAVTLIDSPEGQNNVWKVREVGLGLLMSERTDHKPIDFIEDAAVPVENLAAYIQEVEDIIHRAGTSYAIYAHASAGCLHVRPLVNLKTLRGRQQYREIAEQVVEVVLKYRGTTSGEHGEGLVRSEFSERLFGPTLTEAFRQLKRAFDPHNLLNPGKVVDAPRMDDPALLRYNTSYEIIPLETRLDWSADGGLAGAVEMCNGAGVCRKEDRGTMCPSYMATLDEAHSTRGRANALRAALSGKLRPDNMASQALYEVLDLCLSCKACKSECPSSVDVAKMKGEFLALYHDAHGVPLRARLFANIHRLNRLGSLAPRLTNALLEGNLGRWAAQRAGLPTERPFPRLARRTFSAQRGQSIWQEAAPVVVIDTFTEYNHPEIGLALWRISEKIGQPLNFIRLAGGCCGRPALSKGLLDQARRMAEANLRGLLARLNPSQPLLFLEPSCQSAFIDDYADLVGVAWRESAKAIVPRVSSAEAWLRKALSEAQMPLTWDEKPRDLLLHGHCHQKALWGTPDTLALLRVIPQTSVRELDAGCCGMAGSFGYEHPDLSRKIADLRLLPALAAKPQARLVAPGTSCRAQVGEAGYQAVHPVQIVAEALR